MRAMISSRQIRAARGLLEWTGKDLAEKLSMMPATISKIEADLVKPTEDSLFRISDIFDKHGVEFLEGDGVKMRQHEIRVFSGKAGYRQFLDHAFLTLKNGGRIRQFNLSDSTNLSFVDDYGQAHLSRMKMIDDLDAKVLTTEGDTEFPASYCTYRWISKDDADMAPFYLYNDYVVLPMYESSHKREWISINSKLLAERYTKQFDKFWANASVPKKAKGK